MMLPHRASLFSSRRSPANALVAGTALAAASWLLAASTGCSNTPGGPQYSMDRYTFESTTSVPQTVTLRDLRTGEELWTTEIPVGHKLTYQFYENRTDNEYMPDLMRWEIYPITVWRRGLRNSMSVPAAPARRIDVQVREAPEFAPEAFSAAP